MPRTEFTEQTAESISVMRNRAMEAAQRIDAVTRSILAKEIATLTLGGVQTAVRSLEGVENFAQNLERAYNEHLFDAAAQTTEKSVSDDRTQTKKNIEKKHKKSATKKTADKT